MGRLQLVMGAEVLGFRLKLFRARLVTVENETASDFLWCLLGIYT